MKIGINLLLWTDHPKPDVHYELLANIKQWGFNGVEFPVDALEEAEAVQFSFILDDLKLGRTTILALDASEADPASTDPILREAALIKIKRALEVTKALGAELLCGPLFQGLGRFTGDGPTREEWMNAVAILREAGVYAASLGVRIALEPLNRFEMYLVNTLDDGVKFVREVDLPNVGLLADTHHGNIEELNVAAAWLQAAPYIQHIHISENNRGVPGTGHAITDELFEVMFNSGYEGWLTIEAFGREVPGLIPRLHLWRSHCLSADESARMGLSFIQDCIEAAGGREGHA